MIDTIAAFDGRLAKVEGAERSGKTQALVARCAHLIQNGEAPASILVAVTNAFAAQAFRKRLRRALPANLIGAALSVRVCTALDAAASVLDQPAAREATGRVPRILNNAEYNFFLEDLKTVGEQPRKLHAVPVDKNLLDFFQLSFLGEKKAPSHGPSPYGNHSVVQVFLEPRVRIVEVGLQPQSLLKTVEPDLVIRQHAAVAERLRRRVRVRVEDVQPPAHILDLNLHRLRPSCCLSLLSRLAAEEPCAAL